MCLEIDKERNNLEYNLHSIKIEKILDRMGFPNNYMNLSNIERSDIEDERKN